MSQDTKSHSLKKYLDRWWKQCGFVKVTWQICVSWKKPSVQASAAVVLWRHLGNGGNWWTYPVSLQSQLMWAPLCSPVRRPQAGRRAVSRDTTGFHDFLHGLRCTYMNSGMSGWKGQTLLILKCWPMLRCSPHIDTHLTFSQKSVNKNYTRLIITSDNQGWSEAFWLLALFTG